MRIAKRRHAALIGLLAGSIGVARAAEPPFALETERLENGLVLVLVPFDAPGLVAYNTLVRAGSRNEVEPGHTGFAHFFEHMMFRGTPTQPDFDGRMAELGWSNNAWTAEDETVYTDFGLRDSLPEVIALEADRFHNLAYSEAAFRTEAGAILGEYNKSASSPFMKLDEVLSGAAFTEHTYRHTVMGFLDDIRAMPERYAYSKAFFRRFYTPDNCVIVVAGDFDAEQVRALVRAHYGTWRGAAEPPAVPPEPPQTAPRQALVEWPGPTQPRLVVADKVPAAADWTATAAQSVLFPYLFGTTSPLYQELVLERQLVRSFQPLGWGSPRRDPGIWGVIATSKSPDLRPIEAAIEAAVADLSGGDLDADRLARIKSNVRYGMLLRLDDPSRVAAAVAIWISATGEASSVARRLDALEAIAPEQVVDFARSWLVPGQRTTLQLLGRPGTP